MPEDQGPPRRRRPTRQPPQRGTEPTPVCERRAACTCREMYIYIYVAKRRETHTHTHTNRHTLGRARFLRERENDVSRDVSLERERVSRDLPLFSARLFPLSLSLFRRESCPRTKALPAADGRRDSCPRTCGRLKEHKTLSYSLGTLDSGIARCFSWMFRSLGCVLSPEIS